MKNNGITLIALVVTIVVLLILAGVSISMLTGENGIITQAQESKIQTEIGKEKEYITLSVSAIKGDKISRGDTSEITSTELQTEINNYTSEATVTGSGKLTVKYESGRSYEVDQNGNISPKEELTPEEAKKIVNASGCGEGLIAETADGTVYYVKGLQEKTMQKIDVTDAEIITTSGIKEAGQNYFIDNKGKVYTWGDNECGQLGNGTDVAYSDQLQCISDLPENALNGKNIIKIQTDSQIMIAIDNEGKVYTWGDNYYGQLGNGTNIEFGFEPRCISDIVGNALNGKNIKEIVTNGNTVIALDSEGKVYTWGSNGGGKLGNGTYEDSNVPICISDIVGNALNGKNIKEIETDGLTVIAIDGKGKVYTWGSNRGGKLGNGTYEDSNNVPICISDIAGNALNGKNITEIEIGIAGDTVIAIDIEGKVYTWGENDYGQLGNGTGGNSGDYSNEPQCISDISGNALNGKNITEIEIGIAGDTVIAIDIEGKVYTWGHNNDGQLGNGTDKFSNVPICISDIPENELNEKDVVKIQYVYNGYTTVTAIDSEGKVYAWGSNDYGQIVAGTDNTHSNVPICIMDIKENKLYNKKIKLINFSHASFECWSYITVDGELYNYSYRATGPM